MRRWTVFISSHDTERTKVVDVSSAVLALTIAAAAAVCVGVLVGLAGAASLSVTMTRGLLDERPHRALAAEVVRLDRRAPAADTVGDPAQHGARADSMP